LFLDARVIDQERLNADLCVIGAGAAGIAIALQFADLRHDVVLLESGGLARDAKTQSLYAGDNVGLPYAQLDECRSRFLGGSTNCWLGWCRPLDPIDFEPRPWMSSDGWPIRREELISAYEAAQKLLLLGPFDYKRRTWESRRKHGATFLQFDQTVIEDSVNQISPPARFGRLFRSKLEAAKNIRALLHATVTELVSGAHANSIEEVHVARPDRPKLVVVPKLVVLATGGIENARLLLASDRTFANGVGNAHGLVGRYFMDHPRVCSSRVRLSDAKARRLYDHSFALVRQRIGLSHRAITMHFTPTEQQQRARQLPNSRTYLVAQSFCSLSALRAAVSGLVRRNGRRPGYRSWGSDLMEAARRLPAGLAAGFDFIAPDRGWGREFYLETVFEPVANPSSRVALVAERDRLGMRKVSLDWRLSDTDHANYRRTVELVLGQLVAQGIIEPIAVASETQALWPEHIQWCWHHMGTTRMHRDPTRGVVDADCRVHGLHNLFIAGSSVFPTPGSDTPTLTIVAMALRLAWHLRSALSAGGPAPVVRASRPPVEASTGECL
jgi:choline dehydrogenase-like flavoprotein